MLLSVEPATYGRSAAGPSCNLLVHTDGDELDAILGRAANLLLHLADEIRHEHRPATHLGRNARSGHRRASSSAQPDLLAVADAKLFGVVGVEFHEALRIIEQENPVFPLERLAVLDQDILIPVVERVAENQREWIILTNHGSLRVAGNGHKLEPLRGQAFREQKPRAERTVLRARPLAA